MGKRFMEQGNIFAAKLKGCKLIIKAWVLTRSPALL